MKHPARDILIRDYDDHLSNGQARRPTLSQAIEKEAKAIEEHRSSTSIQLEVDKKSIEDKGIDNRGFWAILAAWYF